LRLVLENKFIDIGDDVVVDDVPVFERFQKLEPCL
jgi:hypothetical protein